MRKMDLLARTCVTATAALLSNSISSSATKLRQPSIVGYAKKTLTGTQQAVPVTKQGIKEHLLAIITTCDLVSNARRITFNPFVNLINSHFASLNAQRFAGSFRI